MIKVTQSADGAISILKDGSALVSVDSDGTIKLRAGALLDLTQGTVSVGTLQQGEALGVDATIDIPLVGVITVSKGIVTDFTAA